MKREELRFVPAGTADEYARRLNAVVLYITEHLATELMLKDLAREACFSQFHFHRLFTSIVGETPAGFVKRLRTERAANMLDQQPALRVTAIALACGFSSPAVFSRAFRDVLGCSPTAWRFRKNRKVIRKHRKAEGPLKGYLSVASSPSKQPKGRMSMNVSIKELPPVHVAYVANMGGYTQEKIGKAWSTLCRWAAARNLLGPEAELIGMSFDNPDVTPAERCRYYACVAISPHTLTEGPIGAMDIPGGRHAVYVFHGVMKNIPEAYREFYGAWLPASGYQPADRPSYEIYRSTPDEHRKGEFRMEICMPIESLR